MTNPTTTIDTTTAADTLNLYLKDARRYAYLSPEEERDLATRWHHGRDAKALDRLVGAHLRLAFKVAKGFQGYGLPLADLVAEANLGLMTAAQKFDSDRGFRFATYATWWIRAAVQEYVLHNWSLVKIGTTAAQKKLFFGLRRLKAELRELESGDLSAATVTAIATELDVPEADVVSMNRRLGNDRSLNVALAADSEMEWQDLLADETQDQEHALAEAEERSQRLDFLKLGLNALDDRERQILVARRLRDEPETLEELSQKLKVSRERVRQLEVRAFEKVRKAVTGLARARESSLPLLGTPFPA